MVQSDSASSCSKAANAVFASEIVSTGNYSFTFTAPGTFYYICSVGTHCAAGW